MGRERQSFRVTAGSTHSMVRHDDRFEEAQVGCFRLHGLQSSSGAYARVDLDSDRSLATEVR